ncbi:transposase [Tateyamaria sp. syn59]|uniref:IS110 family transposase n=1 Tax=Tateyamaria sp. syn59 TaxID=2576942 RepID=UPI001CB8ABD3|nr:transposase [Tateyamaria sp. syn59]
MLKMMPTKTDRHDARGLAQIVRTGWFEAVQIKSHAAYVNRALLTARETLVGMRVRLENEIHGLLKTFRVMLGKRVGGFKRRAEEIVRGELAVAPELVPIFEALMQAAGISGPVLQRSMLGYGRSPGNMRRSDC